MSRQKPFWDEARLSSLVNKRFGVRGAQGRSQPAHSPGVSSHPRCRRSSPGGREEREEGRGLQWARLGRTSRRMRISLDIVTVAREGSVV